MKRDDEIKTLASIVCTTRNQAGMRKLYRHCLVDMSLQHPAKDRFVESSSTVALLRVNCVEHTRQTQKNREAKELSHHPKLSALCAIFLKKKNKVIKRIIGRLRRNSEMNQKPFDQQREGSSRELESNNMKLTQLKVPLEIASHLFAICCRECKKILELDLS